MKRCFLCLAMLAVLCMASVAHAGKVVIAVSQFVEHPALDAVLKGFQDELREGGVEVDYRIYNAHGNMSVTYQIANKIVSDEPDMIVAIATPPAQACLKEYDKAPQLKGTPMLFTAITDPLGAGLVSNYEKPGGDVTGMSNQMPMGEHVDMIRKFIPELKSVGVVYNVGESNSVSAVTRFKAAAKERGVAVEEVTVANSAEVQQAATSLLGKVDAIFVPTDNTVVSAMEVVVKVCRRSQTPLFVADTDSVARGAVAAVGFDYYLHGRQTGAMAIRILNGAKPGDTPVEFQKKLTFQVFPAAAKKMGLEVPQSVIDQADKVIE
ncbi:ABC transporter permease [Pseudodesulfovibrio cashew]|uniref:ABC transporter permease n=1 Tax=Pseudodesulfovibrio cashew TaxID=2678688 RepID=A0A6I6JJU7_9BACT|nr:ABC transporter substrate-binding protein [Pseudodesulfovibrio cashew]QGY40407.1 ABC transporter permease [Pseudodesulfovibrio cashew]